MYPIIIPYISMIFRCVKELLVSNMISFFMLFNVVFNSLDYRKKEYNHVKVITELLICQLNLVSVSFECCIMAWSCLILTCDYIVSFLSKGLSC